MNIEEAVKLCKKGKLEKFAFLYDSYVEKIYRFIYYKTHHKETAEDLTSDTFLKALEKINSFKEGSFQAWLFKIARNTVIDYYRKKKSVLNIDDVWDLGKTDNIVKDLEMKEKLEKVYDSFSKLNSIQREIVLLRIWEDMPYKEIAEIVGKKEGACKMIFTRAISKLKNEIPLILLLLLCSKIY